MLPILSDERIYAYIPDTRYTTVAALRSRYERLAAGSPSPAEIWWNYIVFRRGSPEPIGYVQATLLPRLRLAHVAYVLSPLHWGQGHATEALGWLLAEIARRGDIDTAQAQIDARNHASMAVVRRLGFTFTRTVVEEGSSDHLFERTLLGFAPPDSVLRQG